jgi:hypothetical protein
MTRASDVRARGSGSKRVSRTIGSEAREKEEGMFCTMKRLGIAACVAVALGATCVAGASASLPMSASGTFTTASILNFDLIRSADGNEFFAVTGTTSWTGTFSGTSTEVGTVTFHPDGNVNFRAVSTFTGTVNGVPGTVTFELSGREGPDLDLRATAAITSATGGLAGLHGVVTWQGTVGDNGPLGTYSGQIESSSA